MLSHSNATAVLNDVMSGPLAPVSSVSPSSASPGIRHQHSSSSSHHTVHGSNHGHGHHHSRHTDLMESPEFLLEQCLGSFKSQLHMIKAVMARDEHRDGSNPHRTALHSVSAMLVKIEAELHHQHRGHSSHGGGGGHHGLGHHGALGVHGRKGSIMGAHHASVLDNVHASDELLARMEESEVISQEMAPKGGRHRGGQGREQRASLINRQGSASKRKVRKGGGEASGARSERQGVKQRSSLKVSNTTTRLLAASSAADGRSRHSSFGTDRALPP